MTFGYGVTAIFCGVIFTLFFVFAGSEIYFLFLADIEMNGSTDYIDGCIIGTTGNMTKVMCKKDFGLLGYKQWMDESDERLMSSVLTGLSNSDVKPDCAYGVSNFKMIENIDGITYEYQCHTP